MPSQYQMSANLIKEGQKYLNEETQRIFKRWQDQHPNATNIKCKPLNVCYVKKPRRYYKVPESILSYLLRSGGPQRTQKAILEDVQREYPEFVIPASVWSRDITGYLHKRIQARITNGMRNPISIRGLKTLAQIKKALKTAMAESVAEHKIKSTIIISDEVVVVGRKIFPITIKKHGDYEYPCLRVTVDGRRQWVNLRSLLAILEG